MGGGEWVGLHEDSQMSVTRLEPYMKMFLVSKTEITPSAL